MLSNLAMAAVAALIEYVAAWSLGTFAVWVLLVSFTSIRPIMAMIPAILCGTTFVLVASFLVSL